MASGLHPHIGTAGARPTPDRPLSPTSFLPGRLHARWARELVSHHVSSQWMSSEDHTADEHPSPRVAPTPPTAASEAGRSASERSPDCGSRSFSQERGRDSEPHRGQREDSHQPPSAVPSWGCREKGPLRRTLGAGTHWQTGAVREVTLIFLMQPFREFRAGAGMSSRVGGFVLTR